MLNIQIKQANHRNIGSSLNSLITTLPYFQTKETEIRIDISEFSFLSPILLLPLACLISDLQKNNINVHIVSSSALESYLSTIKFYQGLNTSTYSSWEVELRQYLNKSYLPICRFPAEKSEEATILRDSVISVYENIITNQLKVSSPLKSAIKYLISEWIDNIRDHANVEEGWIMIQNYPKLGYMDICIADRGISLLGA